MKKGEYHSPPTNEDEDLNPWLHAMKKGEYYSLASPQETGRNTSMCRMLIILCCMSVFRLAYFRNRLER